MDPHNFRVLGLWTGAASDSPDGSPFDGAEGPYPYMSRELSLHDSEKMPGEAEKCPGCPSLYTKRPNTGGGYSTI